MSNLGPHREGFRGLPNADNVYAYTTTGDQSKLFEPSVISFNKVSGNNPTVVINPDSKFQTIDGFGAAITGSTAYNLKQMTQEARDKFLKDTFDPDTGMGYSFIRISIGCSDFSLKDFTECDKEGIDNFALDSEDTDIIIPIIQQILKINPSVKIIATPWTPPIWMKVSDLSTLRRHNSFISGYLDPRLYQEYATYFVKYVQAMAKYNFHIYAITLQNEPLNKGNSASCFMGYEQQRDFIKTALGPQFATNNISTKIIIYDHNYNYDNIVTQEHYPVHIYDDAEANKYIDGAAYHAYGGFNTEMDYVTSKYPNKNLYFTEIAIGEWNYNFQGDLMWNTREIGIGTLNKGSKCAIMWNLLLDTNHGPYRPNGCSNSYGAVDVKVPGYSELIYRSHYYDMAHLSKVIKPDSIRLGTTVSGSSNVYATSAINTNGFIGAVLLNDQDQDVTVSVHCGSHAFDVPMSKRSVVSVIWKQ